MALAAVVGFGVGAASAIPVGAQEIELRAVPGVGVMNPFSVLYRSDLPPATGELTMAPVLSLGLHALPDNSSLSVRLTFERLDWFDTDVVGTLNEGTPNERTEPHTVPTSITVLAADVLLRLFGEDGMVPYLFGGLGWKNYSFGEEDPPDVYGFKFPQDGSSGRINYGVGLEFHAGGRLLAAEAAGSFNRFVLVDEVQEISRPHDQHELILKLSMPISVVTF